MLNPEHDTAAEGEQPTLGDSFCVRTFEVCCNASLSKGAAWTFFGGTALASLIIAGSFAIRGYWPILPFAGLELFVLGLALGLSMKRGRYRELVSIFEDRVVIERGGDKRRERIELPRHWARVELARPAHVWYPSRLFIRSHGRSCEVGRMLTESERRGLGRRLAQLIGPASDSPALSTAGGASALDEK